MTKDKTEKEIKSLNMDPEAWQWLREMAEAHKCSMSEFCQDIIGEASGKLDLKRKVYSWKDKK